MTCRNPLKDTLIDQYAAENIQLKHELGRLKDLIFGTKSERFQGELAADQLSLAFESETPKQLSPELHIYKLIISERKQALSDTSHPGRAAFPASLPREEVIIQPKMDLSRYREICRKSQRNWNIPGKLFVWQYIRPKYERKNTDGLL